MQSKLRMFFNSLYDNNTNYCVYYGVYDSDFWGFIHPYMDDRLYEVAIKCNKNYDKLSQGHGSSYHTTIKQEILGSYRHHLSQDVLNNGIDECTAVSNIFKYMGKNVVMFGRSPVTDKGYLRAVAKKCNLELPNITLVDTK